MGFKFCFKERDAMQRRAMKSAVSRVIVTSIGFGMGFLVLSYALGVFVGGWLDTKFDTKPVFTIVGVGVALVTSFIEFIRALKTLERTEKEEAARAAEEAALAEAVKKQLTREGTEASSETALDAAGMDTVDVPAAEVAQQPKAEGAPAEISPEREEKPQE